MPFVSAILFDFEYNAESDTEAGLSDWERSILGGSFLLTLLSPGGHGGARRLGLDRRFTAFCWFMITANAAFLAAAIPFGSLFQSFARYMFRHRLREASSLFENHQNSGSNPMRPSPRTVSKCSDQ